MNRDLRSKVGDASRYCHSDEEKIRSDLTRLKTAELLIAIRCRRLELTEAVIRPSFEIDGAPHKQLHGVAFAHTLLPSDPPSAQQTPALEVQVWGGSKN